MWLPHAARRLVDKWIERPALDWLAILPAMAGVWVPETISSLDFAKAVSSTGGILIGVTGLLWSTYQGGRGARMNMLRNGHGPQIRRNWLQCLLGLIAATFLALIAVPVTDHNASWVITIGAASLALARALRVALVMNWLSRIADLDSAPKVAVREDIVTR